MAASAARSLVAAASGPSALAMMLLAASLATTGVLALSPECQSYLQNVAGKVSSFGVCSLLRARPFTLCTNCYDVYASAYNTLVDLKNGRGQTGANCSEDLVSGDRVSIINRDFDHLINTWSSSNCDNCLLKSTKDDQISYNVSQSTLEFEQLSLQTQSCVDSCLENKSAICQNCMPLYQNFSSYYSKLYAQTNGGVCMDILDLMNRTRAEWSSYGCVPTYSLNIQTYVMAGFMFVITALFYLSVRFSQEPLDVSIMESRTMRHHVSRALNTSRKSVSGQHEEALKRFADPNS